MTHVAVESDSSAGFVGGEARLQGLRVAYVAFEGFPNSKGSGTRIRQMTQALTGAGAEVHLVTLAPKPGAGAPPRGVVLHPINLLEDNLLARALAFRDRVLRELVAIRPDVVHFRGVFEGEACLAYGARRRVPTLFELNGLPSIELSYHYTGLAGSQSMQAKLRELEARVLQGTSWALTQSQTTLEFMQSRGLPATTPRVVIPNAADPDLFRPAAEPLPPPNAASPARLLYVGATQAWQGTLELLMATRRVAREMPVALCMVGPMRRRWRKQIERSVHRLKLDETVQLLGAVPAHELPALIQGSHVCLAPLRRDVRNKHQGCSPIKVFEYMSCGRPVVSTDLACMREIIQPGITGELIESPRPKALADALLELLQDDSRRLALGDAARQYIQREATWELRRNALVDFYASRLSLAARASA
ncbi:MAG: glycosyltransferase family 4 protein [Polyangiaceae bacterium]